MTENKSNKFNKYFAASNSYDGFKSFFNEIFDPVDFDRLFILKGGPGTGKNSFMKKIKQYFIDKYYSVDEIYCSSDPTSLDGLIIKNENTKIAIIDGTSPHERDTILPGATDDIINLGQNWDRRWLVSEKPKIVMLNEEKRKAYSTAYEYLKIGKNAFEFIKTIHTKSFDYEEAEKKARKALKGIKKSNKFHRERRLISAFGKNGLVTLDGAIVLAENKISIGGNFIDFLLFAKVFETILLEKGISHYMCTYPLSIDFCEAIYIPEVDMLISFNKDNATMDANDFSKMLSKTDNERIKKAKTILNDSEEEASRWFKIASEFHFRLENIYSRAMSFDKNDKMLENTIFEIETIFNK